jgi:hypothetical protein
MAEPTNALTLHSALTDTSQREHVQKMLAELLITVSDQLFQDKNVTVDGYRFINCSFVNCKLQIMRGTFEFHHCTLTKCTRLFSEGALKSVQLYALEDINFASNPSFCPKKNTDGSFSIAKGASMT